jgi:hypothetical protein
LCSRLFVMPQIMHEACRAAARASSAGYFIV